MGHVQTVLGPVAPESLGRVLHHEHLLSLTPGPWLAGGPEAPAPDLADAGPVALARHALSGLAGLGIDTVVDLSPYGVVGRSDDGGNVVELAELARTSGVTVIAGSSVYLESFSPAWTLDLDLDALTRRLVADAVDGIGDTGVRVGIYGEQATSLGVVTEHEEKCLRAAARAARETGLALTTHTTHGTMVNEQLAILAEEGADLSRVVIGHLDIPTDDDDLRRALDAGANIAFDTIGKQHWDFFVEPHTDDRPDGEYAKQAYFRADARRADRVARLVAEGYGDQLLLAMDLTGAEAYLNPATHGRWGYSYLGAVFVPALLERGVPEPAVETMLRDTPLRLLTIAD